MIAHLCRTVGPAVNDIGKIRCVKAHLTRGEDQRQQRLPGGLCIAASAESGNVSRKSGSFRRRRPGDQHGRPPFPIAVRLEYLPIIGWSLCSGSVIYKLQAGRLGSCCYCFPDQGVSPCQRVVRPDNVMDWAAWIIGDQLLACFG